MVARVATVAFQSIDVPEVGVQVQIMSGLPTFAVVGLPDKPVAESRERMRASLAAMGFRPSTWRRRTSSMKAATSICRSRLASCQSRPAPEAMPERRVRRANGSRS